MFICKICDQKFDKIPDSAEKIAQTIFRFEDGTVHILARRKAKPVEVKTETEIKQSDECKLHWPLDQINRSECNFCIAAVKQVYEPKE